jgi:hypothetical protein
MQSTAVTLEVSYSQLAVFHRGLESPFNEWKDGHVAQGFSWRPGSVSFRTLEWGGTHRVEVVVRETVGSVSSEAVRAIDVPFVVPDDGAVEVASIADSAVVMVPPGLYLLRCELLPSYGGDAGVRLVFASNEEPVFRISLADEEVSDSGGLLTTAEPAA